MGKQYAKLEKETPAKSEVKVEPKKKADPREVVSLNLPRKKALLSDGGKAIIAKAYLNKDKQVVVGVSGKPVLLEDWVSGKAEI